jgi:ubiquitin-like-conjugating enzyme ATG3
MQNLLHTLIDPLRDRFAPISHNSTFRENGQVTPEEFVKSGDYLVFKFPSWSWQPAASPSQRVSHLPEDKQFLITRGVPCRKRIKADDFAGSASGEDQLVHDMLKEAGGEVGDADDGWLKAGGNSSVEDRKHASLVGDVRTVGDDGKLEAEEEEEEIPDMEDEEEDEEAIIRDYSGTGKKSGDDG